MAGQSCFAQLIDSWPADCGEQSAHDAPEGFLDEFTATVGAGNADVPDEDALLCNIRDRFRSAIDTRNRREEAPPDICGHLLIHTYS